MSLADHPYISSYSNQPVDVALFIALGTLGNIVNPKSPATGVIVIAHADVGFTKNINEFVDIQKWVSVLSDAIQHALFNAKRSPLDIVAYRHNYFSVNKYEPFKLEITLYLKK